MNELELHTGNDTGSLLRSIRPGPPVRWPNKVSLTLDDELLRRIDADSSRRGLGRAATIRTVLAEHYGNQGGNS